MVTSYDEWLRQVTEKNKAQQESEKAAKSSMYDTQKTSTQAAYDKAIKDTEASYEDDYRENEVQKLINERAIAENMANLGLTNSGLNRTQQTAAQLSYANQKGSLDRQKQSAVDELTFNLAQAISAIDTEKAAAIEGINSSYAQLNSEQATALYNAGLEAETQREKALIEQQTALAKENQSKIHGLTSSQYNTAIQYFNDGEPTKAARYIDNIVTGDDAVYWYDYYLNEMDEKQSKVKSKVNSVLSSLTNKLSSLLKK